MEYHSTDCWWTHSKSNAPKNAGIPNNVVSSVPEPVFLHIFCFVWLSSAHSSMTSLIRLTMVRIARISHSMIFSPRKARKPVSSFSLISRISTLFCWNLNSYVLYWHSNVMNWPPQRAINDGKLVQWFLRKFQSLIICRTRDLRPWVVSCIFCVATDNDIYAEIRIHGRISIVGFSNSCIAIDNGRQLTF